MRKFAAFALPVLAVAAPLLAEDHDHEGHHDLTIASDASGGGKLVIDYDLSPAVDIVVSPLGPPIGGMRFYTSADPGFAALLEDELDEGVFELNLSTQVGFRLLGADLGASLQLNGNTLDTAGQTALIGTYDGTGDGIHNHPTWTLFIPEGDTSIYNITFELYQANGSTYATSDPYTISLSTAVPEPASLAGLALASAGLLRRRRR